jgi:uncharacterized membrane protein
VKPDAPDQSRALEEVSAKEVVREQDKVMLALAYLGPLALVPLVMVKDSQFVQWHAKNGLVLGVGGVIALSVMVSFLSIIPILRCLAPLFGVLGVMALAAIDLFSAMKAQRGERFRVPVTTELSEKL